MYNQRYNSIVLNIQKIITSVLADKMRAYSETYNSEET